MMTAPAAGSAPDKLLSPEMRYLFVAASILVFAVGVSLFLLTEQTDKYFAWTIANPLTAAFLGAGYWASGLLELAAARERLWRNARIAVPAVSLFTALTLLVTLLHWDRFHFDSPRFITQFGTWFWLGVYVTVPFIMLALLLRLGWSAGGSRAGPRRSLGSLRYLLLAQGAMMAVLGAALLLAPLEAARFWAWSLTDLTGRAIGAWLLSLGVAALHVGWEDDLRTTRPAIVGYGALAVLQLVALARYGNVPDWGDPRPYLYLAFLLSMLVAAVLLLRDLLHRGILLAND